jgi:DNA-binding NarL/FixJ family response regulator
MPFRIRHTPTSVLLVERLPIAAEHAARTLKLIGFDMVWRARSIAEALRTCRVTPFDIAIIQLQLGAEDGGHLVTALRAWPGSVDLIVGVSMDDACLRRAASARLPVDALLLLPLDVSVLSKAIGHKVRKGRFELADGDDVVMINDGA